MTRITNFGRKRTYVEAGFTKEPEEEVISPIIEPSAPVDSTIAPAADAIDQPPKKKRKRNKKPKDGANASVMEEEEGSGGATNGDDQAQGQAKGVEGRNPTKTTKSKANKKGGKDGKSKAATWRAEQSEQRRLKRIAERNADTICFACRQKGHAARDCPATPPDDALEGETSTRSPVAVGICYRCGSKRHSLSRCKKKENPQDPLPFASCFVCSGKGHLASTCPKNKSKGIYPNGGSCKLCGDTTHLAKNCGLRKDGELERRRSRSYTTQYGMADVNGNNKPMLYAPAEDVVAGADEDDFHTFKRRTAQIDREERTEEKTKKMLDLKAGALSGIVKAYGKPAVPPKKKAVVF
ncbi:hypothetical protein HWV62_8907 [Athelia sp. TMB]|nr:hypothetical protein HWV62_8907 [Athelia sp. TMB]